MTQSTPVIAYLGLGSNLDNPLQQLQTARRTLAQQEDIELIACSSLYHSTPIGPQDQPDYLNGVVAIRTTLTPLALLHSLQAIEQQQGRVRLRRWGERTLDLDILLYGTQEINLPDLVVPHLCLTERAFVLLPLYEIAPELIVPRYGAIAQLLAEVGNQGLQQLNTAWH